MQEISFSPFALLQHLIGSQTLLVNFSFRATPPGKFSQYGVYNNLEHSRLFLNCVDNEWYRYGIEGLGNSPEEVCAFIRSIAKQYGYKKIITSGLSKGGYGALLYGLLLRADAIVSFGPEIVLNLPFGRSLTTLGGKASHKYDNLIPMLKEADRKNIFLIVGEKDIADLMHGHWYQAIGGKAYFLPCDHSTVSFALDRGFLDDIFANPFDPSGKLYPLEMHGSALQIPSNFPVYDGSSVLQRNEVIDIFRILQKNSPKNSSLASTLGDALRNEGMHREAKSFFELAYQIDPSRLNARYDLARHLYRLGDAQEALSLVLEIIKNDNIGARFWSLYGALLVGLDSPEQAVEAFKTASALEPSQVDHHYQLGRVLLKLRRYSEAEASLVQCISLRSHPGDALNMAFLKFTIGEHEEARSWINQVLQDVPLNEAALSLAEKLNRGLNF